MRWMVYPWIVRKISKLSSPTRLRCPDWPSARCTIQDVNFPKSFSKLADIHPRVIMKGLRRAWLEYALPYFLGETDGLHDCFWCEDRLSLINGCFRDRTGARGLQRWMMMRQSEYSVMRDPWATAKKHVRVSQNLKKNLLTSRAAYFTSFNSPLSQQLGQLVTPFSR